MKKTTLTCIAVAAILALAGPVSAAGEKGMHTDKEKNKEQMGTTMDSGSQQEQFGTMGRSADEIKGLEVYSQNGEELGEIEEVALDEKTGKLRFVTLSQGGILGIGDEDIAVAAEALRFEEDRAILTVDSGKLENAPQQENISDDQFQRDLQTHYGVSPAWEKNQKNRDKTKAMDNQKMQDQSDMNKQADQGMEKQENKKDY